jgi:hypothetical protein
MLKDAYDLLTNSLTYFFFQMASSDPRERVAIDTKMSELRETGRLLKKQIKEILVRRKI